MDDLTPLILFGDEVAENKNSVTAKDNTTSENEVVVENISPESSIELEKIDELDSNAASDEDACEKNDAENGYEEAVPASESEQLLPDKLDSIFEFQQQLLERINSLSNLFESRIMHTDHEEKIVDQMHKELQKYKEDMYAQLIRPILLDIIELRDSIMRMTAAYLAKPEGEQDIPNKTFSGYAFDLQDILEKNDVEIYRSNTEEDFAPIKQLAVKKVSTSDESLHGKIAETLSCGYNYNGRTISAEKVAVYYYEKSIQKNDDSEVINNG